MTWGLKLGPSLHVKENKKFEVQPHKTTLSNIDVVNEIQRIRRTFRLITPYKWQIEPNLHLGGSLHHVMTWGLKLGPSFHVKENKKFEVQPHKTTLSNIDVVNEIQRIRRTFRLITPYKWQIEPNLHLGPRNDLRYQTWSESTLQRK